MPKQLLDETAPLAARRRRTDGLTTAPIAASNLFIGLAIIAVLYFGREIFVPLVIAGVLSFVLAPLVLLLRRWHFGRVGGVFAAVLLVLLVIFSLGAVMAEQVAGLVENLPRYEQTISSKIHTLQSAARRPGVFNRLSRMYGDLRQEISKPQTPAQGAVPSRLTRTAPAGTPAKPVTVEVQSPTTQPIQALQALGAPLLVPLAKTGIVLVFVVFMLLFREDVRDRFVRLAGAHDLGRTSAAMDDAGRRLSRYFLTQTIVNASFGVLIGVGLWLIGVPNPLLWGVLAGLVRFVPYVGAIIAAAGPAALAVAVAPDWAMLFWTLGLFAVIELSLGQVVEPLLYGHHTGLSPVAVIVAATFWTWLWGPVGLLLSTPLTVCVMVLGRHIERFEFLHIMLGDEPALTPEQSFFQGVLAGDAHETADQAEKFLKGKSLCEYYDDIAIPGLMLARLDAQKGVLDADRLSGIKETVEELVDDLSDHDDSVPSAKSTTKDAAEAPSEPLAHAESGPRGTERGLLPVLVPATLKPEWQGESAVLCVGARDALDEAAAAILAQLMQKHGMGVRIEPPTAVLTAKGLRLESANVAMVCVACLGSTSPIHRRYLVRRLRRRLPRAKVLVLGLWASDPTQQPGSSEESAADRQASSFRQALEICIDTAQGRAIGDEDQSSLATARSTSEAQQDTPRSPASAYVE